MYLHTLKSLAKAMRNCLKRETREFLLKYSKLVYSIYNTNNSVKGIYQIIDFNFSRRIMSNFQNYNRLKLRSWKFAIILAK